MIITPEQFNSAYRKLPFFLREYIAEDDLAPIVESVGTEHDLHVDAKGALYRETTNMLLGLINPTQFVGELKTVGIPAEAIGSIVEELNAKIFIPLREKMQNPSAVEDEEDEYDTDVETETSPAPPQTSSPAFVAPTQPIPPPPALNYSQPVPAPASAYTPPAPVVPTPSYIPPAAMPAGPSISQFADPYGRVPENLPSGSAPFPPTAPVAPAQFAPTTVLATPPVAAPPMPEIAPRPAPVAGFGIQPPAPLPPAIPQAPVGSIPGARTMQKDMQTAEAMANTSTGPRSNPVPTPPIKSAPKPDFGNNPYTYKPPAIEHPPVATKIQVPDEPLPASQPAQKSALSQERTENKESLYSALKQYGIDPYREPAE